MADQPVAPRGDTHHVNKNSQASTTQNEDTGLTLAVEPPAAAAPRPLAPSPGSESKTPGKGRAETSGEPAKLKHFLSQAPIVGMPGGPPPPVYSYGPPPPHIMYHYYPGPPPVYDGRGPPLPGPMCVYDGRIPPLSPPGAPGMPPPAYYPPYPGPPGCPPYPGAPMMFQPPPPPMSAENSPTPGTAIAPSGSREGAKEKSSPESPDRAPGMPPLPQGSPYVCPYRPFDPHSRIDGPPPRLGHFSAAAPPTVYLPATPIIPEIGPLPHCSAIETHRGKPPATPEDKKIDGKGKGSPSELPSSASGGRGNERVMPDALPEESDAVAVNAQVKEAAKQALALGGKVPAPDWRICSTHDKKRRRDLWVLPQLRIQFDTRKGAFEFEEFRKILPDGPSALAAYKEMKRRLGEQPRVRALNCDLSQEEADRSSEEGAEGDPDQVARGDPDQVAAGDPANFHADEAGEITAERVPDQVAEGDSANSDVCYVCEDGGELVCCDFCPKAFHTNCHTPRLQLESIPPGSWKCMECLASSFERKQRCGVCYECKRPGCGKCSCCRRKKSFGGDGKYGKPCKLKHCKSMRYASTEKPRAKSKSKMSISARGSTKRKPVDDQAIAVSKKPRLDPMASAMVQLAMGRPATPKKPSPGKGWVYKLATLTGDAQQRYVWLSPARKIPFKRRSAACIFEELRTKFGGDEVRAWQEYRRMRKGKDAHVVAPARYDAVPTQLASPQPIKPTKEPPGPGWVHKLGSNGKCRPVSHWISPIRKIEFKRWEQANKFEELREEFGTDEVQAWKEYRKITKPLGDARVVAPGQYDNIFSEKQEVKTAASAIRKFKQPLKQSPGKGWTCKRVLEASNPWPICYWSSPERGIEFKRHAQASEFEALRKEYDGNEFDAWEQYRKIKRGKDTWVVDPRQYDASCPKDHTPSKRSFEYLECEADAKPKKQQRRKGTAEDDEKLAGLMPEYASDEEHCAQV